MGVNPLSIDSARVSDPALAIWWAGPVIGVLNLIPVLPLDGGHLAMTGLEGFLGKRALRTMVIASLVITGAGAIFMFGTGRGGFGIFVAFLLINQFQMLQSTSKPGSKGHPATRVINAEAQAWKTGQPGMLEPGQRLSPWYEAHVALSKGDQGGAMGVILADLRSDKPARWTPPTTATAEQLQAIVEVLPHDLPAGNDYSARVLADILLALGHAQRAGDYAAIAFSHHRTSPLASVVARSAARLGDADNSLRWLHAATEATRAESDGYRILLSRTMDQSPTSPCCATTPISKASAQPWRNGTVPGTKPLREVDGGAELAGSFDPGQGRFARDAGDHADFGVAIQNRSPGAVPASTVRRHNRLGASAARLSIRSTSSWPG